MRLKRIIAYISALTLSICAFNYNASNNDNPNTISNNTEVYVLVK